MTLSKPETNLGQTPSTYCINPACKQPINPANASICAHCGTQLLLQDRYRVIRAIGSGGFGRTFLAIDELKLGRPYCVVKQFFPQQQGVESREKAAELFRLEAQRLEALGKHDQIPQLLEYFETDQYQYLVQEFVDGFNLAQELATTGHFDEPKIRQLLTDLLPILQFVHSHQVIHRDIKPENIIRRQRDGRLVLVDFGAAKYTTETTLGKTGTMIGSAAYTAPEQVRGKAVYASDLYSLGVTCIYLLTQVPPFELFDSSEDSWIWRQYLNKPKTKKKAHQSDNRKTTQAKTQFKQPVNSQISPQLGLILDKLIQGATNRRYQSADEVLHDLSSKKRPKTERRFKKRWIVAGTVLLLLSAAGVRSLLSPIVQQTTYRSAAPMDRSVSSSARSPIPGGLFVQEQNGQKQSFPLQHTEVMARVSGNVSRVEVTQTFTNPFKNPLEAVYVFPLPDEAAVDDMEIKVGNRIIRGLIKKREEAKKVFEQAKKEGKTAGLLEQERDNVFTQSLANIKPGEKIDVTIRYTDSLKFEQGNYEFVFPMVVGPRYIPGDAKAGQTAVADASKITPPTLPENRSGQDIAVTVEIAAGVPIKAVQSPSHPITTTQDGRTLRVQLANANTIPNKDLVLKYQVAGNVTQSTVLTESDERGGHFAAYLIPAVQYQQSEIVPKDVVFLIDTSGSQAGEPMEQSKQLMRRFISGLNPNDTFNVVDFSNSTTQLSNQPLPNTAANRQRAIAYVNKLDANGGTELFNGIDTVLKFPPAPDGRLRSIVLLTDGLIGDDERVIAEIQKRLKPGNRLYSFGVGFSVNRFLVDRMAELGQGTSQVVLPDAPTGQVVEQFFQQINRPVLTNVQVAWEGTGAAPEIYPLKPTDLFTNQPLVLFGKKGDRSSGVLKITGTAAAGQRYEKTIPVNFNGNQPQFSDGIAQLWGRARIKELSNQMFAQETPAGIYAITETALAYRLLSKYTAFVAVTQEVRVNPQNGQKMAVPVNLPQGMPEEMATASSAQNNSNPVPEPGEILGTLVALFLLWLKFGWKRRKPVTLPIKDQG